MRRALTRVGRHRGEAAVVSCFMVVVGLVSGLTGASSSLARLVGAAGVASGILMAFATVWLPIAVIDFRRCTRETNLRVKVEADLERHTCETRARQEQLAAIRSRSEAVLAAGGPDVVFQPIVEVARGGVVGYEALSRFAGGEPPDRWFADAARVGLGVELELAAVTRALAALPQLPHGAYLSINASPEALLEPRLVDLVARSGPERITVELTEHVALADYSVFGEVAAVLRRMGARLAVDDAGAGYSSLRHIVDLHPDTIKVDRSLVHGMHADPARRSVMVALMALARDLGATLVAEGVEDPLEEEALRRWGIRFAQGWYYGRPQALEALGALEAPQTQTLGARAADVSAVGQLRVRAWGASSARGSAPAT